MSKTPVIPDWSNRIIQARSMVQISRPAFCDKHAIKYRVYQQWELGTREPEVASLEELCVALLKEGIVCDIAWILKGEGRDPYFIKDHDFVTHMDMISAQEVETTSFYKRFGSDHNELMHHIRTLWNRISKQEGVFLARVRDDAMAPTIEQGDFVIACWEKNFIPDETKQACIVLWEDKYPILRSIYKSHKSYVCEASNTHYKTLETSTNIPTAKILFVIKKP